MGHLLLLTLLIMFFQEGSLITTIDITTSTYPTTTTTYGTTTTPDTTTIPTTTYPTTTSTYPTTTTYGTTTAPTTTGYTGPYNCTPRNGTSITVLMDQYFYFWGIRDPMKRTLDRVSARFPCVQRQYTSVILDPSVTYENIFTDEDSFLASLTSVWDWNYYYNLYRCAQPFLYGLKRALEISPDEAFVVAFSFGSISDINDAQLLSDIHTLIENKRSQVYILYQPWYCSFGTSQQEVFDNITALSFGETVNLGNHYYYKVINSMDLLLSKPMNSSSHILGLNVNVNEIYTDVFNITTSLTHLLIITDGNLKLIFSDPGGNTFEFDKAPDYSSFYQKPYLIKDPAPGTWTLTVSGSVQLDLKILGFAESESSGMCSNCDPNASCEEFGGYQECTCKPGFQSYGQNCYDIDECQNYYDNDCQYNTYGCINTIGSYTCGCYGGFEYKEGLGCVDIDECSNSSLNNCHPLANCTNTYSSYMCTCAYGYYGDGRYCEVNECQQGACGIASECTKYYGSYSCYDPCNSYTEINDPWRSVSNTYDSSHWWDWYHCDYNLYGWSRFKGVYDKKIPDYCVPMYTCGTNSPMWLNGSHPAIEDGIVNRTACANWYGDCCAWSEPISVKMCPGGFYVYKLQGTPTCNLAYCTVSNNSCSDIDCASDEECLTVNGNNECHCKETVSNSLVDGLQSDNPADYLKPQILCGLESVEVNFSKCLLEKLGFDPLSIHLRDVYCRGSVQRNDKSYVIVTAKTYNGVCGANIVVNETEVTYRNTLYFSSKYDGVITREEYPLDFHCSYPLNMDISLLSAINPFSQGAVYDVGGTANYSITMGLFQDSAYSISYTGSQVSIPMTSKLYVGVIASGAADSSHFVLIMKNCYATPTPDRNFPTKYDIIKDHCPNRNDPTISIVENGVSLKGRFSVQIFKFLGGYSYVYLHCQIGLCNKDVSSCSAWCPSARAAVVDDFKIQNITLGPINKIDSPVSITDSPLSVADPAISTGGTVEPFVKMTLIVVLLLLYLSVL